MQLLLAAPTEERRALPKLFAFDQRPAHSAGFSHSAVNLKLLCKVAGLAVSLKKIF